MSVILEVSIAMALVLIVGIPVVMLFSKAKKEME